MDLNDYRYISSHNLPPFNMYLLKYTFQHPSDVHNCVYGSVLVGGISYMILYVNIYDIIYMLEIICGYIWLWITYESTSIISYM